MLFKSDWFRFRGVYIAHSSKEDVLCTLNFAPGKTVYGEKKISVDVPVEIVFDWIICRELLVKRRNTDSGILSVPSWVLL